MSWPRFQDLARELRPFVPAAVSLVPGTTFGPYRGRVRGTPTDLTIADIALLFATSTSCRRLAELGVRLPPLVPAQLQPRGAASTDYVECDIPEAGRLALSSYHLNAPEPCSTCGRWDRTLERPLLEAGSIPEDYDLARPANHPTILLASQRFRDAVHDLELTGIALEAVETEPPDA